MESWQWPADQPRLPMDGALDVLTCADPGYQEKSHAGFCYCSQLPAGPIPAGLDSSNWIPSVLWWWHAGAAGDGWWVWESVGKLCVGAEGKVTEKSFICCDLWPRIATYLKPHLFVCVCVVASVSEGCSELCGEVQHPCNTLHPCEQFAGWKVQKFMS